MKKIYQSRDLYLSGFLLLHQDIKLINTSSENGIIYFIFENSPKLQTLTLNYFSGEAQIDPLRFIESIKRLRHLIRDRLKHYS